MQLDYTEIGRRIKKARLDDNMTQEILASKIKVSVAYLSRIERGAARINLKRLTQISEALKVSPSYILFGRKDALNKYFKDDIENILNECDYEQQKLIYQISSLIKKIKIEKIE